MNPAGPRGAEPVELQVAAVSGPARVAAESTEEGVRLGRLTSHLVGLPGTMLPPINTGLDENNVSDILRDERLCIVRKVTLVSEGTVLSAFEWWLRRTDSAVPIALEFKDPCEGIALPADGLGEGICALSIEQSTDDPVVFDMEKNLQPLRGLRSFTLHPYGWGAELSIDLSQLATLPFLTLLSLGTLDSPGRTYQWIGVCAQLRYIFCTSIHEPNILASIAPAPNLRSLELYMCSSVTTIAPLQDAERLECLHLWGCGGLATYEPLAGMKHLRSLSVGGRSFDSWELLGHILSLERLRVQGCSKTSTSTDGLAAAAAPHLRSLSLYNCDGIEIIGPMRLDYLEALAIRECECVRSVDLAEFNWLQGLTVSGCQGLTTMILGKGLASLTSIKVIRCPTLRSLVLSGCTALQTVEVSGCQALQKLFAARLTSLKSILVETCGGLRQLDISGCTALHTAHVSNCKALEKLIFKRLASLACLSVPRCRALHSLDLRRCLALAEVTIKNCDLLSALLLGEGLASLTKLVVFGCPALATLDLSGCTALREVDVPSRRVFP